MNEKNIDFSGDIRSSDLQLESEFDIDIDTIDLQVESAFDNIINGNCNKINQIGIIL